MSEYQAPSPRGPAPREQEWRQTRPDTDLAAAQGPRDSSEPRHYTRFVRVMKFALPAVALILVSLIFLWPQLHIDSSQFSLGFAHIKVSGAEFPSMVNARFVGTDHGDQPFSVTADIAKSISINSSDVELEMPKGDLGMRDGASVVVTANTGVYDQKAKTLKLQGAVDLFHDSGYEFKTAAADVDFGAGTATGDKPVEGQGPWGQLTAEGFRLSDAGKRLYFTGKSKLTITPSPEGSTR